MPLVTRPNLAQTDDFYAALLAAHEGLSETETQALNARLILVLANHIGDLDTLTEALALAGGHSTATDPTKR
ncbi:MAG: DUF2783 domain-containing protein [Pseudomonadota bacterium]